MWLPQEVFASIATRRTVRLDVLAYVEANCHSLGDGLNQEFWSRSWLNLWFWASRLLMYVACLLILFCLCWECLDSFVLPSFLENNTWGNLYWCFVRTHFFWSTPTIKCHSQMAPKLHNNLHTIRCLKSTAGNCHIVQVSQFINILIFGLLIGIDSKFWFICYYFSD